MPSRTENESYEAWHNGNISTHKTGVQTLRAVRKFVGFGDVFEETGFASLQPPL